jgi:hypothetical protein
MIGEVAGAGAGSVLMFVLTSSAGLREFTRNRTSKATRGTIVSSRITATPSLVKRRCVRPLLSVSKNSNWKDLRRVGGPVFSWVSCSPGRINRISFRWSQQVPSCIPRKLSGNRYLKSACCGAGRRSSTRAGFREFYCDLADPSDVPLEFVRRGATARTLVSLTPPSLTI